MRADAVVITSTQVEYDTFRRTAETHFGLKWREPERPYRLASRSYYLTETSAGFRIALVKAREMGQVHAAITTKDVIHDLSPQLILLVGIAAGLGKNVQLGDVVCASEIRDYELGKLQDNEQKRRFPGYHTDPELLEALKSLDANVWQKNVWVPRPSAAREMPQVYTGDVLCGNKVVANEEVTNELMEHFPYAIALEMESYGAACAINHIKPPPLFGMVKGICDRANSHKNDEWQQYAACVASSFVLAFLDSKHFLSPGPPFREITDKSVDEETDQIIHCLGIDPSRIPAVEHSLVRDIVSATLREASDILSGSVSQRVDRAHAFHLRAISLFREAKQVYAVSLDSVSTFWASTDNRYAALRYLDNQARDGEALRLFVFTNADTAHWHSRVLDMHAEKYKNVFVCSLECYKNSLVPLFRGTEPVENLLARDFALLRYSDGALKFAELTDTSLDYQRVDIKDRGPISFASFEQVCEGFKHIARGKCGGPANGVLHWEQRLWKSEDEWAGILIELFPERTSECLHLLFFDGDPDTDGEVLQHLAEIKREIAHEGADDVNTFAGQYGIRLVWFGELPARPHNPRDFLHDGHLRVNEGAPRSILLMQFKDYDGLKRFEEDEYHSRRRKGVYTTIEPHSKLLFELAAKSKNKRAKKALFEAIESLVAHKFKRWDFVSTERIREMVSTVQPFKP